MKNWVEQLRLALLQPLPGEAAHILMAPMKNRTIPEGKTPRKSAVMGLMYPKNKQLHMVLIKRNSYAGTHSAQVSFPGGQVDERDNDDVETAIRETHEEIGLLLDRKQIIGQLTQIYIPPSNFLVQPILSFHEEEPNFNPDPREVHYIIEFPVMDLLLPELQSMEKIQLATGLSSKVPCFKIGNEIVWGATAIILSELRSVMQQF